VPRPGDTLGGRDRAIAGSAASASQMGHFETKWLGRPKNLARPVDWQSAPARSARIIVPDMTMLES
jgi:hypothetical protein